MSKNQTLAATNGFTARAFLINRMCLSEPSSPWEQSNHTCEDVENARAKYKQGMPKPILLAIDDDTSVLEAVVQDLRRHYGQHYRIVRAASGLAALDISRQLLERKDTVALFLSDQRMPGMTGVDFLQQALEL